MENHQRRSLEKIGYIMPEAKKKVVKKAPKVSKELVECQEAITYLLEEVELLKDKIDRVMGRMGL